MQSAMTMASYCLNHVAFIDFALLEIDNEIPFLSFLI